MTITMKINLLIACLSCGLIFSQEYITGSNQYKENDKIFPLEGANVFWQDTSGGTSTNGEGFFELEKKPKRTLLVISHLGFKTDTVNIKAEKKINHFLTFEKRANDSKGWVDGLSVCCLHVWSTYTWAERGRPRPGVGHFLQTVVLGRSAKRCKRYQ